MTEVPKDSVVGKIPVIGLGTGKIIDFKDVERIIDSAIELGYRHFDTAYGYKNEAQIGHALRKHLESNIQRKDLFLVSKLPINGMHHGLVSTFLKSSLAKLQVEYLDLYLIHWPVGVQFVSEEELMPKDANGNLSLDLNTNLEEIWMAMEEQVEKGRAKAIGVSNFNMKQLERILKICRIAPSNLQIEVHAYFQQTHLRNFCFQNGISVTAYAPLGSQGRRTYINAQKLNIPQLFDDPLVIQIAASKGKTPAQILLKFLNQGLRVIVIPKTVSRSRLKENIEILDFELSKEEIDGLKKLDEGELRRSCLTFDGAEQHPECPFYRKSN